MSSKTTSFIVINHKNIEHVMPAEAFGAVRPVGAILPTAFAAGPLRSRSRGRLRRSEGLCRPVMLRWCFPRYHRWLGFPPDRRWLWQQMNCFVPQTHYEMQINRDFTLSRFYIEPWILQAGPPDTTIYEKRPLKWIRSLFSGDRRSRTDDPLLAKQML